MRELVRLPHWRRRYISTVEQWRRRPFEWGSSDCVSFASACVEAITGVDLAGRFTGRYSDPDGAHEILGKEGWESLAHALSHLLPEMPAARGRTGDLAMIPPIEPSNAFQEALGVVNGATILCRAPNGLAAVPFGTALRCFRVG